MARKPCCSSDSRVKRVHLSRPLQLSSGASEENLKPAAISKQNETKDEAVGCQIERPQQSRLQTQSSVLSTESGFLPKDIQNSSFVDDVIEELNNQGISHSEIICQECYPMHKDLSKESTFSSKVKSVHRHKVSKSPQKDETAKKRPIPASKLNDDTKKRQKNNEASRKSRASRKMSTMKKEEMVAQLEEENQRLTIMLADFSAIATTCKQWIVQKMENPD